MNFKSLFSLLFLVLFSFSLFSKQDTNKVNKKKMFVVSSTLGLTLTGSYLYIENSWWADKQIPFHFDDGTDLKYALNVDKAGHFLGGLQAADLFASSMHWVRMNEKKAIWYGGFFGSALQLAIEMKDAYAPYWGFSTEDLIIGSAGAFLPVVKY